MISLELWVPTLHFSIYINIIYIQPILLNYKTTDKRLKYSIVLCFNYTAMFDTEFINAQERKSTPTVYRFLIALISELPLGNFHLKNNSDFSEDVFFV